MCLGHQMGRQKIRNQTAFAEKSPKRVWRPVTQESVKEKIKSTAMEKFVIYSKECRNYYVQFMKYLQAVGYSKSSCSTFTTGIKEFLYWSEKKKDLSRPFGITSIDQVEESDIENFYEYLQHRPSTTTGGALSESRIRLHMYTLKLFFQHLQDIEQIEINPMGNLNYTRDYKRTRENLLSSEDIEKLYDQCSTSKQKAMLGIIYGCGLRRQEAVKLNAKDIHFKSAMLYVREGKGGRKRTIPLGKTVLNDFKEYYFNERPGELNYNKGDIEAFMINNHGTRMQGDSYSHEIKKLITKANLDRRITLHHFRHAIATHLIESGMKTEHVKDFLGHMSIETTQTYTHITTKEMKKTTAYGTTKLPA
jgi:integrase/recombinase XerD